MDKTVIIKTGQYAGHYAVLDGDILLVYCGYRVAKIPANTVEWEEFKR